MQFGVFHVPKYGFRQTIWFIHQFIASSNSIFLKKKKKKRRISINPATTTIEESTNKKEKSVTQSLKESAKIAVGIKAFIPRGE